MSERDKANDRDVMLPLVVIFFIVMIGLVAFTFKTDIRDLQRRIAVLEQERR